MITASHLLRRISHCPITVGVVGGTGYVGAELVRLLAEHPHVSLKAVTSRVSVGKCVNEHYPYLSKYLDLRFVGLEDEAFKECDAIIFATPLGVAMAHAQSLLEQGVRIIDLSPDFSLGNINLWESHYDIPHQNAELIPSTVFGLPEINRKAIRQARLVSSPSSYSTAILLGILPLLVPYRIQSESLIADVVVGMTSQGRRPSRSALFGESSDSMQALEVEFPSFQCEAQEVIAGITTKQLQLRCVSHSIPLITGVHATLYAQVDPKTDLFKLYADFYKKEHFVDVLPAGCVPETRMVKGSNYCKIAPHRQRDEMAVILVAIDNLIKGAAGQAVQNLNIMFGFSETEGLTTMGIDPTGHIP
ncbi:N-acetyl-gamma-glutamyl-phosphate reductase [Methylobacillus caricis]|uniref:N-acetyl-gamma-glutamyl-phosphate reductase n=1 Tax=Methylobacillus caricis TaxID=1971611 RepID=UPI001CFF6C16|nr:N-acetyl-gamma-glutamyl-phosphate reductase [Methylobacillus caricis]MCB5186641.1 N-acetyl-gamma-glutamyl-phosphate reductase [Methylobacillus caricis]